MDRKKAERKEIIGARKAGIHVSFSPSGQPGKYVR